MDTNFARNNNETTPNWLERLIALNAPAHIISAVQTLLQNEAQSAGGGPTAGATAGGASTGAAAGQTFFNVVDMPSFLDRHSPPPGRSLEDFREILRYTLPFKIPIPKASFVDSFPTVFCPGSSVCGDCIVYFLNHKLASTSESAVTSIDSAWLLLIKECIPGVLIYQHDDSSQAALRPDAVVLYNNALVMKVEAKQSEDFLTDAENELTDKFGEHSIGCFPSRRNSVIGIATTPSVVTMWSLFYDDNTYQKTILKSYDFSNLSSRVQFIQDIFKMILWIRTVTAPNTNFHLMQNILKETRNGHKMIWDGKVLVKTFKDYNLVRLGRIRDVYARSFPNVEWGEVPHRSRRRIHIKRIGKRIISALREGLVTKETIIAHVKAGIEQLHSIGLAHCDICLENIFYDEANSSVFLDDIEYLTPIDDAPPHYIRIPANEPRPATARDLDFLQFQLLITVLEHV